MLKLLLNGCHRAYFNLKVFKFFRNASVSDANSCALHTIFSLGKMRMNLPLFNHRRLFTKKSSRALSFTF
ncbi:hypothetical protein ACHQM5_002116 [Ranunculus cassubicifolius]